MSLATLNRKTKEKYKTASVGKQQFSINGSYRNQGWIGQTSLSRTTYVSNLNNMHNVIKPSVINSTMAVTKKIQQKPFTVLKTNKTINQSDLLASRRRICLDDFSKIVVSTPIRLGQNCLNCTTTKIVPGNTNYDEYLYRLTMGAR